MSKHAVLVISKLNSDYIYIEFTNVNSLISNRQRSTNINAHFNVRDIVRGCRQAGRQAGTYGVMCVSTKHGGSSHLGARQENLPPHHA